MALKPEIRLYILLCIVIASLGLNVLFAVILNKPLLYLITTLAILTSLVIVFNAPKSKE